MRASFSSLPFQVTLTVLLAVIAAAWWLTVPGMMSASTFAALWGVLAACIWVVKSTLESARPSSSLAQSLHDVETTAAANRSRRSSGEY